MLKVDGTCDEAAAMRAVACDPQFSVVFNIATVPSPELPPEVVAAGNVSAQMAAWLQRMVGPSLGSSPREVAVADMRMGRAEVGGAMYMDGSGLLHFDLSFAFCTAEGLAEIDWRDFEHRFRLEVQRYEAFQLATLSILHYAVLGSDSSSTTTPLVVGPRGEGLSPAGHQDANTGAALVAFLTSSMAVLGIAAVIAAAVFVRGRRRSKIAARESGLHPDGDSPSETGSRFLATAISAFSPEDVEQGEAFAEAWLGLDAGDIVEVVAGTGGWLYGYVLARPERAGLFPENCVSWMGVIADGGALDAYDLPVLEQDCFPAACAPLPGKPLPSDMSGMEDTVLAAGGGQCRELRPELAAGSGADTAGIAGPGAQASTLAAQHWPDAGATDDVPRPPV